jgi:hypothetical protein
MINEFSQEDVRFSRRDWKMLLGGVVLAVSAIVGIDGLAISSKQAVREREAITYDTGRLNYNKGLEIARRLGYKGELPAGTEFEVRKDRNGKSMLNAYVSQLANENVESRLGWTAIVEIPEKGLEAISIQE